MTFLKLFLLTLFLFVFFSFRLAQTPNGINLDEASYGYNGALLAHDLHDQHGRFLPIFILASDNKTWYPPYMQYLVVLLFKLFGPSIYVMRLATVIVSIFSALLTLYFAKLLFDKKYAIIALISFLIIPEVMIETHTPLEHMIVVPFVLLWLIGLLKYKLSLANKYLVLAAISLGTGFYSYAGIRPFVAVAILLSMGYVTYLNWKKRKFLVPLIIFCSAAAPFFVIIPILEFYYAGAVLNRMSFQINSIYDFAHYYLASFDISFLFVTGDKLLVQSTLRHGMFLLSTLPLFLLGLYQAFKQKSSFLNFLGLAFFATPFLFGYFASIYFAHRLMFMIPFYTIFVTLAVKTLLESKAVWIKYICFILFILVGINYLDFWKYYMFDYPKDSYHVFHHMEDYEKLYKTFLQETKTKNLQPFMSAKVARVGSMEITDTELFSRAIYFPKLPTVLAENETLPSGGILMSEKDTIAGLKKINSEVTSYNIFIKVK